MNIDEKTFNKKVKNIRINSMIEKNNFTLIRKILTGEVNFPQSNQNIDSNNITNKVIFDNDIEIFLKIGKLSEGYKLKKDKDVITLLQDKENKLKSLYDTYCNYLKGNYIDEEYCSKLRREIFYLIIELRISLDMSLDRFNPLEIENYCEIIANDVINEKYKRLNFQSHLDYNGKLNIK